MAAKKKTAKVPGSKPVSTPTRSRPRPDPIIGSSSTWREQQLDEFGVEYNQPEVDAKSLFDEPEKWFDFSGLGRYKECILASQCH